MTRKLRTQIAAGGPIPATGMAKGDRVAPQWRLWLGLALCALAAVIAFLLSDGDDRRVALWTTAAAASLYLAAIAVGALRIRRRGHGLAVSRPTMTRIVALIIGFVAFETLGPSHSALLMRLSIGLSSVVGGISASALLIKAIYAIGPTHRSSAE